MEIKKWGLVALVCCMSCLLGGCGKQEATPSRAHLGGLQISNYNFMGKETLLYFDKAPERVLVTRPEILDVLAALGVEDRVVMASFPRSMAARMPDYQKCFPNTELTLHELDQETAVMARPDFIIGWRRSFHRGALGSTEYWQSKGVPVYIEENSGPIPAMEPFPPGTVDSELTFIRNMGKIFQRQEQAEVEIAKIKGTLARTQELARQQQPRRALSIAFMRNNIEVFGDKLLLGNIVNLLGSENINYPYPFINGEQFLKTDPDVIFVVHHGGPQEAEFAKQKLLQEPYCKMRAVKNNRICLLDYQYICASNVRTATTIELIYRGLYE